MPNDRVILNRYIGILAAISINLSCMLGGGIFISIQEVLKGAGSIGLTLVVYIFAGAISLLGSLIYAELGCRLPYAGGDYEYLRFAFGDFMAFLYAYTTILIVLPFSMARTVSIFSEYLIQYIFPCWYKNTRLKAVISTIILAPLTVINCANIRTITRSHIFFASGKLAVMMVMIGLAAQATEEGMGHNYANPFENVIPSSQRTTIIDALYFSLYCFKGWNRVNAVCEEIKDVRRVLAVTSLGGVVIAVILIVMVVSAYMTVLTPIEIIQSDAIAYAFIDQFYDKSWFFVILTVGLCTIGTVFTTQYTESRILFAAARNHHFPSFLRLLGLDNHQPTCSVVILGVLTTIAVWVPMDRELIILSATLDYTFILASTLSLIIMQRRQGSKRLPFHTPLAFPVLFLCVILVMLMFTFYSRPVNAFMLTFILILASLLYVACIHDDNFNVAERQWTVSMNVVIQKLTISAFDESLAEDRDAAAIANDYNSSDDDSNDDDDDNELSPTTAQLESDNLLRHRYEPVSAGTCSKEHCLQ